MPKTWLRLSGGGPSPPWRAWKSGTVSVPGCSPLCAVSSCTGCVQNVLRAVWMPCRKGGDNALDGLATEKAREVLDAVSDRIALQHALAQLSEEHRDTFMLRYLSQFSAAEVASILEIPVGTVESRCHFARERLKTILKTLLQTSAQQADDVHNNGRQSAKPGHRPANAPSPRSNEGKKPGLRGYFK